MWLREYRCKKQDKNEKNTKVSAYHEQTLIPKIMGSHRTVPSLSLPDHVLIRLLAEIKMPRFKQTGSILARSLNRKKTNHVCGAPGLSSFGSCLSVCDMSNTSILPLSLPHLRCPTIDAFAPAPHF